MNCTEFDTKLQHMNKISHCVSVILHTICRFYVQELGTMKLMGLGTTVPINFMLELGLGTTLPVFCGPGNSVPMVSHLLYRHRTQ